MVHCTILWYTVYMKQNHIQNKKAYNSFAKEYQAREKSVSQYFKSIIDVFVLHIKTGINVLDVGCGVGISTKIFNQKNFNATGIEFSPEMVAYAKQRNKSTSIIEGDFFEIEFQKKFDAIFLSAFLHLFPKKDTQNVLYKVFSLLKKRGVLFVSTTVSSTSKEGWESNKVYVSKEKRFRKHWTETELRTTLTTTGFTEITMYKTVDSYDREWMNFIFKK